jgi:hypothetical protein
LDPIERSKLNVIPNRADLLTEVIKKYPAKDAEAETAQYAV